MANPNLKQNKKQIKTMFIAVDNNINYAVYDSVKAIAENTGIKYSTLQYWFNVKKVDRHDFQGLLIVKTNLTVSSSKKRFKKFATNK